ncbi:AraC family transcriptional regulator [Dactylosporangium sp. NPDC051485]|uniref:AraC family transcriptional regulator n=1 Tax=Dactylosporangium sp. NPDC051485 TaxID=3154846 RepID=UPI0034438F73
MDDSIELAVERAITTMHENLGERLTVDDMARAAMFSKFHFTRVFQRTTGVSPGRFLSALRLQQAKRLLVSTSLSVVDISMQVGYNSVGTFSSRFSRSVGMSPTVYRRRRGYAPQIATAPQPDAAPATPSRARVSGWAGLPSTHQNGLIFIGLFAERVPEGQPVRCTVLTRPGPFRFDTVPEGNWYLLAQSIADDDLYTTMDPHNPRVCVATHGPLEISSATVIYSNLQLKPVRSVDPPVLLALMDARKLAMARLMHEAQEDAKMAA